MLTGYPFAITMWMTSDRASESARAAHEAQYLHSPLGPFRAQPPNLPGSPIHTSERAAPPEVKDDAPEPVPGTSESALLTAWSGRRPCAETVVICEFR
jgi:hypothetical protein